MSNKLHVDDLIVHLLLSTFNHSLSICADAIRVQFPVWGKGFSYSAVAVNLDVKKGYLRDDALKLLSLASSPELTEKEGLCINAPWYTGHCEQKSHFGLEMSAQIYRVEGT